MGKSLLMKFFAMPVSFLKRIGFEIDEEMAGTYRDEMRFAPDYPFRFDVTWGTDSIWQWLQPGDKFLVSEISGTVTADNFCDNAACSGTLTLRYFGEHRLRYEFWFGTGGRIYRFVGEKVNIRWWNLPVSHTTCFGRITENRTGQLVATALVFFRLRTIPRFLRTFRLKISK